MSLGVWYAIKLTMGVRVSAEEEYEGLDVGEHGNQAYPDFATHPASFGHGVAAPAMAKQTLGAAQPVTVKT